MRDGGGGALGGRRGGGGGEGGGGGLGEKREVEVCVYDPFHEFCTTADQNPVHMMSVFCQWWEKKVVITRADNHSN